MHPRLVTCLLISALAAVAAAGFVGAAGAGWLAILLTYSCTGSVATLLLAVLAVPRRVRQPRPVNLIPPPPPAQDSRAVA